MTSDLIPRELRAFFQRRGISLQVVAVLMIIFGVLIIIFPALVGILVGLYMVIAGVVTLVGYFGKPPSPQPEGA